MAGRQYVQGQVAQQLATALATGATIAGSAVIQAVQNRGQTYVQNAVDEVFDAGATAVSGLTAPFRTPVRETTFTLTRENGPNTISPHRVKRLRRNFNDPRARPRRATITTWLSGNAYTKRRRTARKPRTRLRYDAL